MSESKEAKAVKAAMGITEKPANETSAAGNEQNQENGKTTEAKPANGKGREEQKQVIQPKVLEIGKKQPAKPGKEVTPSKEEQAKQEQAKVAREQREQIFSEMLNERFKAKPEEIAERLQKFPDLEKQLQLDPFADPFVRELNNLVGEKKVDVQTAIKYLTTDVEKMSPKDKMAFVMQMETGMPLEKCVRQIDRKYKLGEFAPRKKDSEGKETTEPDESAGLEDLEFDVIPQAKKLSEMRGKLLEKTETRANFQEQQKEVERVRKWQPAAEQILDEFTAIEVETPNKNILKFVVEMEPEEREFYNKEIAKAVKQDPSLVTDQKGMDKIKNSLQLLYTVKNFQKMAITFAEQGRSMSDKEWRELVHNPSLANTTGKEHDFNQNKGSRDEAISNFIAGRENGRQRRNRTK